MKNLRIIPTAEPYFLPGGSTGCLLIHGFTNTPKVMRPLGEYLHKQGHTVLGIRLTGHATRIEDMIRTRKGDWLASAEEGWHLLQGHTERVIVIGLSLGGVLSFILSEKFPVAGVVTLASFYEMPVQIAKKLGPLLIPLSKIVPKLKKGKGTWFNPESEADYVAYSYNPIRPTWELTLLLRDLQKILPKLQTPSLIIHSKNDDYVLPYQADLLYKHLGSKDKQMIWVEEAGHIITRDGNTSKVFHPISDFVKRITES